MGIEVTPRSIKHKSLTELNCQGTSPPQPLRLDEKTPNLEIIYTYSVTFTRSGLYSMAGLGYCYYLGREIVKMKLCNNTPTHTHNTQIERETMDAKDLIHL